MIITNLHDIKDDVPLAVRGVRLKAKELNNFYDKDLTRIVNEYNGQNPIENKIKLGLKGFKPGVFFPLFWANHKTFDWRLKRKMQKLGANFVYIQFGCFYDSYDFFKLEQPQ